MLKLVMLTPHFFQGAVSMIHLFLFVAGLVCLVVGANLLVRGGSKLALSFGISPLVVGLTIVAFGTSAPEVAVSVVSVLEGRPIWPWATWWAATSSTFCSSWA